MSQLRCYTCLQLDRKLRPLKTQVKFVFAWLCPEMFINAKDTARYLICWECEYMADKIKRFQTRLKKADETLQLSFKGKTTTIEGLSCLTVTEIEVISITLPQTEQILPENLPMLPENLPMLPEILPSIPQNKIELSLKDTVVKPLKVVTRAEVKIEDENEEHCIKDFDELILSTTIVQVPESENLQMLPENLPMLPENLSKPPENLPMLPQKLSMLPENLPMLPENLPMLPENLPMLPENPPMLPEIVPSIPQNIIELSLKDMVVKPLKVVTPAEVKMADENEEHCIKDFDELILSTTILQVSETDPLLIPRLYQPAVLEVLLQNPVKDEIIDPGINYVPQKLFTDTSKEQIENREFREDVNVTVEDPNIVMGAEINPVLVNNDPVRRKNGDELLTKLLSTPSKCEELFLIRQRVPNSNHSEENSEASAIDRQHVLYSGVASEQKESKWQILNRTEVIAHRDSKRSSPAFKAKSHKCERCIEWFQSQENLDEHNWKHDDKSRGNSICEICEQRFADDNVRDNHYKQHFIVYECHLCSGRFSTRVQLSNHFRMKHEESTFVCKKCFKVFKTYRERSLHIFETHQQMIGCDECGKMYSNEHKLKRHVLNIHKSKPVECPVCKKIVKQGSLRIHMTTHNDRRDGGYCVECGTSYKSKYLYEFHLKNSLKHNTIEKLGLKCDHCDKYFANKVSLKNHVEEVGGVKYTCDICKKDRKTKRGLTLHIQTVHEGKQPKKKKKSVCDVCGKSFGLRKSLEEHLNSHQGIRPHVCNDCGDTFTYSAALFTHRRLKHNVKRKFEMTS